MEQLIKPSLRRRRSHQQIRNLLTEFGKADLTVKEFCLLQHISPGTFHKWQARLKDKEAPQNNRPAFTEVQVSSSSSGALFAEVSGIRIYQPVTASYLKELLS